VIVRDSSRPGETFVGRVEEIIQEIGTLQDLASQPNGILVQKAVVDHTRERYGMPSVQLRGEWSMYSVQVGFKFFH
jgi:hypothetical protein